MPCVFGYTDPCQLPVQEAFRVNSSQHQKRVERKRILNNRRRRIRRRLRTRAWAPQDQPMFRAANIHYELADKTHGLSCGGIGAMHTPTTICIAWSMPSSAS